MLIVLINCSSIGPVTGTSLDQAGKGMALVLVCAENHTERQGIEV
jgi:hypothetical protein